MHSYNILKITIDEEKKAPHDPTPAFTFIPLMRRSIVFNLERSGEMWSRCCASELIMMK